MRTKASEKMRLAFKEQSAGGGTLEVEGSFV